MSRQQSSAALHDADPILRYPYCMNVAFFLTPKSEVIWVSASATIEQALERMGPYGFTAVPILDDEGRYVGTLTHRDLLWHLLHVRDGWQRAAKYTTVLAVERRTNNVPTHIDAQAETLVARSVDQNFVPVVDDRGIFIGIVTRKRIIE